MTRAASGKVMPHAQSAAHYGLSRTWHGAADLIILRFLLRYVTRPLHFFGPIGVVGVGAGAAVGGWVVLTTAFGGAPLFLSSGTLLLLSAALVQTGVMLVGLGLLAEVLTRVYIDGRQRRLYTRAAAPVRTRREWAGPRPVPAPTRPGAVP